MRTFTVFSILFILIASLLVACGGEEEDNNIAADGTGGLASLKAGSWAEHTSPDGARTRYEVIGDDTWQGKQCLLLEFETTEPGGSASIMQMWFEKSTSQPVLFVMKEDNNVMRMDITMTPNVSEVTGEVPTQAQTIGTGKYTTPTNKTVSVTKYSTTTAMGTSETWMSDEVPFYEVKSIFNGTEESALYDFGKSGATRSISKQEAENAESFGFPTGDDGNGAGGQGGQGGQQQIGQIKITVGPGTRPTISVSEPIRSLMITGTGVLWGFQVIDDQAPSLPGPFEYGVIPDGADDIGLAMSPDLVAGQTYSISVLGDGETSTMGNLSFTR